MILILRPPGRGNWAAMVVSVDQSKHCPLPLEFHVGQRLVMAGRTFRISRVMP